MATAYLKIENPGVAPKEAFTLLGASMSRGSDNSRTVGKFGSGNKHGIAVLLRHQLAPTVFAGNLMLDFGTRPVKVDAGIRSQEFAQVVVKLGGRDENGKNRSSTEDLGFVLEYGATDWLTIDLALREFVSNSLDRAEEESDNEFLQKWCSNHGIISQSQITDDIRLEANAELKEHRKNARPWESVKIEVVNENQVRAKSGTTRVFVPMNDEVLKFFNNLGKWFLHFSEPELLGKTILPKRNRNLGDRKAAVIFRRGVRVREFESSDVPSLFDYNLENLELDESRKVDDWRVQAEAGKAIASSDSATVGKLMQSYLQSGTVWEHQFSEWALYNYESAATVAARSVVWQEAFSAIVGDDAVISTAKGGERAKAKGYKVLEAPEAFVKAAEKYGIRTPATVLTNDEKEGREVLDATIEAETAVGFAWDLVVKHGVQNGRSKPNVKTFRKIMDGGSQLLGYYRDDTVYLNQDIAGNSSLSWSELSHQLLCTAFEEVAHHCTGSVDGARDFQDFAFNMIVYLAKEKIK